jgi:hypothetical protein
MWSLGRTCWIDLWHYTSHQLAPKVISAAFLKPVSAHVRAPAGSRHGPPFATSNDPRVVWTFTDDDEPDDSFRWPRFGRDIFHDTKEDRGLVRFTLSVSDADVTPWTDFAAAHKVAANWRIEFERRGEPSRWAVVTRSVPVSEWQRIDTRSSSRAPWIEAPGWQKGKFPSNLASLPAHVLDEAAASAHMKFLRFWTQRWG